MYPISTILIKWPVIKYKLISLKLSAISFNNNVFINQINLFLMDELSLTNVFNFKNIFIEYNSQAFNLFSNINTNVFLKYYNIQLNGVNTMFDSLFLDYLHYVKNTFFMCFNFNNNLNLEEIFNNYYLQSFYNKVFSYKILPINFFNKQIINYNSWFLLFVFFIIFYLFLIWFYFIFTNKINVLFKNEKLYDEYNSTINYLVESEKELGSLDDMFVGISILICIYGWFFFGTVFFNFFSNVSVSYLYVGFPLFLITVLGMPTNMLLNYGILYPIYLRGSSNTTILILEFMYDVLATTIMYIRLIVQNVRFILMFFAFFECYEFFYNNIFIFKNFYFFSNNSFNNINSLYLFFSTLLNFVILYIYNIGHLMYTIISHFFAYLVLVFWFFSFLYTTFLEEKLELYFKLKKK